MLKIAGLVLMAAAAGNARLLSPVWVELGEGGKAIARVVVSDPAGCPSATVDDVAILLVLRAPVPEGMQPVCEVTIPTQAKAAAVNGQALALPRRDPSRIIVIGDTGCRIKGARVQDCNDPAKWPLERVARRAALEKPDLVIHVGDYLYREDRCPQDLTHLCGTSPAGDRWEAWNADFFTPAAKLLAAAPWAFSRGNHEDCSRAWKGWFYYLDPRPWTNSACGAYPAPYLVRIGAFELVMLDSSAAKDQAPDESQVRIYASQLSSIHATNAWLVDHHPFWGIRAGDGGDPAGALTAALAEAWERASPRGIRLVVSGHTHLFELLSFDADRPPQLIAGDSGTDLASAIPDSVNGTRIRGSAIVASVSRRQFGYTLVTKSEAGWKLSLKDPVDGTVADCSIRGHVTSCLPRKPL